MKEYYFYFGFVLWNSSHYVFVKTNNKNIPASPSESHIEVSLLKFSWWILKLDVYKFVEMILPIRFSSRLGWWADGIMVL
jgi:hypothetical protein